MSGAPPRQPETPPPSWDVERFRAHFPALLEGAAHFDGPGGSQVPDVVGQAVASTLTAAMANRGSVTAAERRADGVVSASRRAVADLLGADPSGVVWGRSMTQLTYDFSRTLAKDWGPGDEIVVTTLDHDANIRPWVQAATAAGATVRWIDFDPATGEIDPATVETVLGPRTRLVALTAASNLIGSRPAVAEIARMAHAVGALTYVDGVHLTPHAPVDCGQLGADFYACSPYKFLGPHCGLVAARPEVLEPLRPDKLLPSSDSVPERFELGTLPYELLAGTTAAIDFLAAAVDGAREATGTDPPPTRRDRLTSAMRALEVHEEALHRTLVGAFGAMAGVTLHGQAETAGRARTPTLLLSVDGLAPSEVQTQLAAVGVNAPAGSFYAVEASRRLGLGRQGAVRVGIAPYNDDDDVGRLLQAIDDIRPPGPGPHDGVIARSGSGRGGRS